MTNTLLSNLGIFILDMSPTDLEMEDLTPQQLEDVIKKVTRTTNADLEIREFLGIDKDLTRINGELKQLLKIDRDRQAPRKRPQKAR